MRRLNAFVAVVTVVLAGLTCAQTIDDVVKLADNGVGQEVLIAFVQASSGSYELSADDIIMLKNAKVPEKVIVAMLRHRPKPVAVPMPRQTQELVAEPEAREVQAPVAQEQTVVEEAPARERVVVREHVVEAPQTTVVYSDYPAYNYYYEPYVDSPSAYIGFSYAGSRCGSYYGYGSYGYYPRYYGYGYSGHGGYYGYSGHRGGHHGSGYRGSSGHRSNARSGYTSSGYGAAGAHHRGR